MLRIPNTSVFSKTSGSKFSTPTRTEKESLPALPDLSLVDPTASTGKIIIRLTEKEKGALKSLTHLQYSVAGDLAEGLQSGALRSTQYLQMKLSARVAQISMDLDSL